VLRKWYRGRGTCDASELEELEMCGGVEAGM